MSPDSSLGRILSTGHGLSASQTRFLSWCRSLRSGSPLPDLGPHARHSSRWLWSLAEPNRHVCAGRWFWSTVAFKVPTICHPASITSSATCRSDRCFECRTRVGSDADTRITSVVSIRPAAHLERPIPVMDDRFALRAVSQPAHVATGRCHCVRSASAGAGTESLHLSATRCPTNNLMRLASRSCRWRFSLDSRGVCSLLITGCFVVAA